MAVLLSLSTGTRADEQNEREVKKSEVPRAVLDAVKKQFPKGTATSYEIEQEDGKTTYEIKLDDGSRKMQVEYLADGTLTEENELLPGLDAAPAAVKTSFTKTKYANWTVRRVKRVIVPEPRGYAIIVTRDVKAKLLFDDAGKLVSEKTR